MIHTKERKRFQGLVRRTIAFLLPLVLVLLLLSALFLPKNNSGTAGMEFVAGNGILAEPANTIDTLIVGDSESFSALSPMQMWEEQGFASYVCGSQSQNLMESYNYLKKALRTQSPKVVILETNAVFRKLEPQQVVFNDAANLLEVFRYHDRWKQLSADDFFSLPRYTAVQEEKGFIIRRRQIAVEDQQQEEYMRYEKGRSHIRYLSRWYLRKIQWLCRKRGIQLVLLSTPSTLNWNYKKHNCIQNYADRHDLVYLDMNLHSDEMGINWNEDSKDGGDHLNLWGAQKATAFFGSWLKEHMNLPDHRSESEYQAWNEGLKHYTSMVNWQGKDSGSPYTRPIRKLADQIAENCGS